jgi:glycerate kinase
MRILLAPDKFKGSFSAAEVCRHLARGVRSESESALITVHPMADGGEGTLEIILASSGGHTRKIRACGPLGDPLEGEVALLDDGSVLIESARFIGLPVLDPARHDPEATSSYGLGLALREVIQWSPARILIGLGGTATMDGGAGMARALGYRLLSHDGREIEGRGGDLEQIEGIDFPEDSWRKTWPPVLALCDVLNPLLGPQGAARVFAPQKGASLEATDRLADGMGHFAARLESSFGRAVGLLPLTGAAGGLGAGLLSFVGARLCEGARFIAEATGLEMEIGEADLVVTGEGEVDLDRAPGKVVPLVLEAARSRNVPAIVLSGGWREPRKAIPVGDVKIIISQGWIGENELFNAGKRLVRQYFSGDEKVD